MIPYGRQDINEQDINSVVEVLQSDFLTQGPCVPRFEELLSTYSGADYCVAVNSATSALHIACLALGLGQGDSLWTSPNTFVASANCGLYCGADIDFVDIDEKTYNICPIKLELKLEVAKQNGTLPNVVVVVHFAGQSCDLEKISELSKKYGFKIIEDASHAIGGKYLDKPIGDCRFSDITIFSFHPVKIITTAEGGVATTNSEELFNKMQLYRSHGITRQPEFMVDKVNPEPWYYEQVDLGFNYRMTELQAALGVSQLSRLNEFVEKRHILRERYDQLLEKLPVVVPFQSPESYSALHLYPIQIKLDEVSHSRFEIFEKLRERGIGVNVHYIPVHTQPYYKSLGFKDGDFPLAEKYYSRAISLPLFSSMTFAQQDKVCEVLKEVLK